MERAILFGLSLPFFTGCYLSHPAGPRADAAVDGPSRDVSADAPRPRGAYWTLERRAARLAIPHALGCDQSEGGRVAVEATVPIESECVHLGPVEVTAAPESLFVITAWVWVEHRDDCRPVTAIAETTVLLPAHEGTLTAVEELGGTSVEYRVAAIDDLPCTRAGLAGSPCRLDCECAGDLVCIPEVGDFVACDGSVCGDPCVPAATLEPVYGVHLECSEREECVAVGAAASCRPVTVGCAPSTCGPGLVCPDAAPAQCMWSIELSAAVRHPCETDGDCDAGLHCVQAAGARSCEVPCATAEMRCPVMHACTSERWVCEWLGE